MIESGAVNEIMRRVMEFREICISGLASCTWNPTKFYLTMFQKFYENIISIYTYWTLHVDLTWLERHEKKNIFCWWMHVLVSDWKVLHFKNPCNFKLCFPGTNWCWAAGLSNPKTDPLLKRLLIISITLLILGMNLETKTRRKEADPREEKLPVLQPSKTLHKVLQPMLHPREATLHVQRHQQI